MQYAGSGPEATGRHHRVGSIPPPADTGRHRAVAAQPTPEPERDPSPRRRHAADVAPETHPDAVRRTRSRTSHLILAGTALLAVAIAPVLAQSDSALGVHDTVGAETAAHPDEAADSRQARTPGGLIGTATSAPAPSRVSATTTPAAGATSTATARTSTSTGASGGTAPPGSTTGDTTATGMTLAVPNTTPVGNKPGGTAGTLTDGVPPTTGTPDPTVRPDDDAPAPLPTGAAPSEASTPPSPPETPAPETSATAAPTTVPTPTEEPADTSGAVQEIVELVGGLFGG